MMGKMRNAESVQRRVNIAYWSTVNLSTELSIWNYINIQYSWTVEHEHDESTAALTKIAWPTQSVFDGALIKTVHCRLV